jgi:gluconokinase
MPDSTLLLTSAIRPSGWRDHGLLPADHSRSVKLASPLAVQDEVHVAADLPERRRKGQVDVAGDQIAESLPSLTGGFGLGAGGADFHLQRRVGGLRSESQTMQPNPPDAVPRSAYDLTGGIVHFARMLDKIRLHGAGALRSDYHANLRSGFDGRCCRFLGVEYPALRERVLSGGTDEEVLSWCFAHGTRPNDEQVLVWNKFMLKRGWRDDEAAHTN